MEDGVEVGRIDPVVRDQAAQGQAVVGQVLLLELVGVVARQPGHALDIGRHPLLDLAHEAGGGGIEGVVQVEEPSVDVPEIRAQIGCHSQISVPAPCSEKSSTSMAWGRRPSRMTTAPTPDSTAAMAVSSLGIIPPVATPSAMACLASVTVIWRISLPSLSRTPATSVS